LTREIRQLRFEAPPGAARLLLVRHGESAPVRDGVPVPLLEGQSDPELDPVGVEQAERVAERLTAEPIAAIYVTPLCRTAQTAAPLARRLGLEPRVEPGLIEVNLGEWEGGLFRQRVLEGHPVAQRMIAEQRWDIIPGAESADAFAARVREGIARVAAAHPDETAVVVSHGGTIGQVLAAATGSQPLAFTGADNGSISELVVLGDQWTVRRYNDVAHL
jgi:2,3-bisphosphoglycerate-dependent phosphoglycerate mutase